MKQNLTERELTPPELEKREEIIKSLKSNRKGFIDRYGKDAEKVMYAIATQRAKKQQENMHKDKVKEMVKSALMKPLKEEDIEVGADKYEAEKSAQTAINMLDDLEQKLKSHDWEYLMSDSSRTYNNGESEKREILKLMKSLVNLGYGDDAKNLYNKYKPARFAAMENKAKDLNHDGKIDSKDYLMARDIAIKKAMGKVNEDDWMNYDDESKMAHSQLVSIQSSIDKLNNLIHPEDQLDAWVQSKLTLAQDYLETISDYLSGEEGETLNEEEPGEVDILARDLYKLKDYLNPSFFNKMRSYLNSGDSEKISKAKSLIELSLDYIRKYKKYEDNSLEETSHPSSYFEEYRKGYREGYHDAKEGKYPLLEDPNEDTLDEAYVPDNIKKFAKQKGVSALVNKAAGWAEKVGARITGGTAIGKNYSTLILDMGYQTKDIYINTDDETIELYGEEVNSFPEFKKVYDEHNKENVDENAKGWDSSKDTPEIKALMAIADDTSKSYTERDEARQKAYDLRAAMSTQEEGLSKGYWAKKIPGGKMEESYATLVNKLKKQGKSEKASKAIAGAVAAYKAKGGGSGPTAKQAK